MRVPVSVWLLMLPVYLICREPAVGFHLVELVGFAVWLFGIAAAILPPFHYQIEQPADTVVLA